MPFEGWLVAIAKVMYDRELSVSERRVKPANIIYNSSLILGKQVIHILPEGYVLSRLTTGDR
jgi:nucleoporin POM152